MQNIISLFWETFSEHMTSSNGPLNSSTVIWSRRNGLFSIWFLKSLVYADKQQTLDHLEICQKNLLSWVYSIKKCLFNFKNQELNLLCLILSCKSTHTQKKKYSCKISTFFFILRKCFCKHLQNSIVKLKSECTYFIPVHSVLSSLWENMWEYHGRRFLSFMTIYNI